MEKSNDEMIYFGRLIEELRNYGITLNHKEYEYLKQLLQLDSMNQFDYNLLISLMQNEERQLEAYNRERELKKAKQVDS